MDTTSSYVVFAYSSYNLYDSPTKYVIGIYNDRENAVKRQKEYCGYEWKEDDYSISGKGWCTFINIFPFNEGV
jgi:hypothetical protein